GRVTNLVTSRRSPDAAPDGILLGPSEKFRLQVAGWNPGNGHGGPYPLCVAKRKRARCCGCRDTPPCGEMLARIDRLEGEEFTQALVLVVDPAHEAACRERHGVGAWIGLNAAPQAWPVPREVARQGLIRQNRHVTRQEDSTHGAK